MDNNRREFDRWFSQAAYDLGAAENSLKSKDFEWSCFQSQQAAEKALKAFLYLKGKRLLATHSVKKLIELSIKVEPRFKAVFNAKELDQYYIPTRYPNGLPDEIPHEFYTTEDALKCVNHTKDIIQLIRKLGGK